MPVKEFDMDQVQLPRVFRSREIYFSSIVLEHDTLSGVAVSTAHDNFLRTDTGDVITLADDAGASKIQIKNLSGTVVAEIDSLGNIKLKGRVLKL